MNVRPSRAWAQAGSGSHDSEGPKENKAPRMFIEADNACIEVPSKYECFICSWNQKQIHADHA